MKIKEIIFSFDFAISILIFVILTCKLPINLSAEFCLNTFNLGTTVLSIIFSIYFTSVTIILSSNEIDYINFLESEGLFTSILMGYKLTLTCLLVCLIYSITFYLITDFGLKQTPEIKSQNKYIFIMFITLFSYSLISTYLSVIDIFKFTKYKHSFINQQIDTNRN